MRKGLLIAGIIVSAFATVYVLPMLLLLSTANWSVHTHLNEEDRASGASQILMPSAQDSIERYGTRGFTDVEVQVESKKYDNLDELCNAIPDAGDEFRSAVNWGNGRSMKDIRYKPATAYLISRHHPGGGHFSSFPTNSVEEDSGMYYWTWEYYVYVYKDGSCRFVTNIMST